MAFRLSLYWWYEGVTIMSFTKRPSWLLIKMRWSVLVVLCFEEDPEVWPPGYLRLASHECVVNGSVSYVWEIGIAKGEVSLSR